MPQASQGDSLSWGDTFFLYLEREGQPLNIGGVCEFEGLISRESCIKFVQSKLPLIPRYLQRVVAPAFNVGLPAWEFDPNFDIRRHIREIKLKQGTDVEVKRIFGELISVRMDRNHPLWDLTLLHGLKGKRTAVIVRVHHCLADGISGIALMSTLMDASPNPPKITARKRHTDLPAPPKQDAAAMMLDRLLRTYSSILQGALEAHSEIMNIVQDVMATAGKGMISELIQLAPELATPAERLPFNKVCRGPQLVAWSSISLPDIKAIRAKLGGTVNDVILTVMTLAFQRYAELHGTDLSGRQLRVVVPVNIRGNGDASELGNRITFLPINVSLDIKDPHRLLTSVSERMMFLRGVGMAEFVGLAGSVISKIPLPLQAFLAPVASQLPLSLCNTICTNVPGPQFPLYLNGHKLLRWYPYVPIGGEMGINTAILSYDGMVYFGYSGDTGAAPDLERLEKFTEQSFAALKSAAGLDRKKGKSTKPKVPRRAAVSKSSPRKPRAAKPATFRPAQVQEAELVERKATGSVLKSRRKQRAAAAAFPAFPRPSETQAGGPTVEPAPELVMTGD